MLSLETPHMRRKRVDICIVHIERIYSHLHLAFDTVSIFKRLLTYERFKCHQLNRFIALSCRWHCLFSTTAKSERKFRKTKTFSILAFCLWFLIFLYFIFIFFYTKCSIISFGSSESLNGPVVSSITASEIEKKSSVNWRS